jgi:hypothetical protein
MTKKAEPGAETPWYMRTIALVIGAGALAAALASVVSLWGIVFPHPTANIAHILSIHIIKSELLTNFAPEGLGEDLPLTPVARRATLVGPGTEYQLAAKQPSGSSQPTSAQTQSASPSAFVSSSVAAPTTTKPPSTPPTTIKPPSTTPAPTQPQPSFVPQRFLRRNTSRLWALKRPWQTTHPRLLKTKPFGLRHLKLSTRTVTPFLRAGWQRSWRWHWLQ